MARVGLPASIIKKYGVTKKAWRIYRQKHGKTNKRRRGSNPKVKRVTRRRRYTRKRRRAKRTIAIAPLIGLAVPLIDPIQSAMNNDIEGAKRHLAYRFLGWDFDSRTFQWQGLVEGYGPVILGTMLHKAMNMLGVNRVFARLPSPLNKLRL